MTKLKAPQPRAPQSLWNGKATAAAQSGGGPQSGPGSRSVMLLNQATHLGGKRPLTAEWQAHTVHSLLGGSREAGAKAASGQEMWTLVAAPRDRWAGHFLLSLNTFTDLTKATCGRQYHAPYPRGLVRKPGTCQNAMPRGEG